MTATHEIILDFSPRFSDAANELSRPKLEVACDTKVARTFLQVGDFLAFHFEMSLFGGHMRDRRKRDMFTWLLLAPSNVSLFALFVVI